MPHLLNSHLVRTFELDRQRLANTKLPIITVSGTFQEDIRQWYGLPNNETSTDVVFSRAHFSMALGVATRAWEGKIDPEKAWLVDPTNYVSIDQWKNIQLTERIGQTLARQPLLKLVKDLIDKFGRNKLPILNSITPPLLYLTELVERPILSFHIAAGNILASQGKKVVQVVTDPHVRPEYVQQAHRPHTWFCVFDEPTKLEFLEVATVHGIEVDPARVIVTGPPIDPRIVLARKNKSAWRSGPLKLCITTGGLGTNTYEIRQALLQLLPEMRKHQSPFQIIVYAGTHRDVLNTVQELAKEHRIPISNLQDHRGKLRVIYHPQLLNANELLIQYGFPWADGFITKPSGDMAYDAVAAGCFLLTLKEWGIWEERIREIFEQKDIARRADVAHLASQLKLLQETISGQSWVEKAMNKSFSIEKLFLLGSRKIIETTLKLS